jgi:hypothetical protein
MKSFYVVGWCPSQRVCHLQTVSEMVQGNLITWSSQTKTDYLYISVFQIMSRFLD